MIQEVYCQVISTRSVGDLVKAMDMSGISKSQVSRLCEEIDEKVQAFLTRPIEGDWPYPWIDATDVKVRQAGRIVSVAVIVAVGANSDGRRKVLGMRIGPSEGEPCWTDLPRFLARRGLRGVKLVISDAHEGIKAAIAKVMHATWHYTRRSRHPMRTAYSSVWSFITHPSMTVGRTWWRSRSVYYVVSVSTAALVSAMSWWPKSKRDQCDEVQMVSAKSGGLPPGRVASRRSPAIPLAR